MHLVIVGEPAWQLLDHGRGIRPRVHSDVIALEGADERLRHAVRLWAADRGGARYQADVTCEGTSVVRGVADAVVGQPFVGSINWETVMRVAVLTGLAATRSQSSSMLARVMPMAPIIRLLARSRMGH